VTGQVATLNLQQRVSLFVIPAIALVTWAGGYLVVWSMGRYYDAQARESAVALARTISLNLRRESDLSDARRLYSLIRQIQKSEPRVLGATIVDKSGEITGDLVEERVFSRAQDPDILEVLHGGGRESRTAMREPNVIEATVPIFFEGSGEVLGVFRLQYDTSALIDLYHRARWRMFLTVSGMALLLVLMLHLVIRHSVSAPLRVVTERAEALAGGDLSARVPAQDTVELAKLQRSFNEMAASLQDSLAALDRRREALEAEVRLRTSELYAAKVNLEDLNRILEARIEERTRQLLHAERLAAIGTLATGVAHEINNPLATILVCAEGLDKSLTARRDSLPPELAEKLQTYLGLITDEARRCRGITAQLLDFSRSRSAVLACFDLRSVIQDAVTLAQPRAVSESKTLEVELEDIPLPLRGDPGAIKQVCINLLINALDASLTNGAVRIAGSRQQDSARIEVIDSGRGLETRDLSRVFEPFFTTKPAAQGTGLGLTICDMIVHQHGGDVRLESAGPGRGVRATVILPLDTASGRVEA
jgi:signal transduction histidine kinase